MLPGAVLRVFVGLRHPSWQQDTDLRTSAGSLGGVLCDERRESAMHSEGDRGFGDGAAPGPDHQHMYAGLYSDYELRWWSGRIGEWQAMGRDVFVYFNNDGGGNAVRNARMLTEMITAEW